MRLESWFLALIALLASNTTSQAQELVAVTTSFQITGGVSLMDLDAPFSTDNDRYVVHSDAVIRRWDRYVFILNRFPLDNVLVLDAGADYAVVRQYSLPGGCNVQDMVVLNADKAFVSCYEESTVHILHPLLGTPLGSVDLSAFADADGLPEASVMARVGELVFVGLQRLDRPGGYLPAGDSMLAVIDGRTDTLVDAGPQPGVNAIVLQLTNPFWRMWFEPTLSRLLVVCSGGFLQLDAGLEVVNPFSLSSEGVLVTEAELGGDLLDARVVSPTLAYALIGELDFDTCLIRFDPTTGLETGVVGCSTGFAYSDLELSDAGLLYLGDRTPSSSGVRVFDAATGAELTASPVNLGLPPFDFVLVEQAVTAVGAPAPLFSPRLRAWPNPFNPRVQLAWTGGREPCAVQIHDARGRAITILEPVADGSYAWSGVDAAGKDVPSGVYFARPTDASAPAARLVLLR